MRKLLKQSQIMSNKKGEDKQLQTQINGENRRERGGGGYEINKEKNGN